MSDDKPNKQTVGTRLPKQTIREIDDYADERDISRSDALRQIIFEGKEILIGDKIATDGGLQTRIAEIEQSHQQQQQQAKIQSRLLTVVTAFVVTVIHLFWLAEAAAIPIMTAIFGIIAVLTFVLTKKGY